MGSLRANSHWGCWRTVTQKRSAGWDHGSFPAWTRGFVTPRSIRAPGSEGKGAPRSAGSSPAALGMKIPPKQGCRSQPLGGHPSGVTAPWGQFCSVPTATRDCPAQAHLPASWVQRLHTLHQALALLLPRMLTPAVTPSWRKEAQSRALDKARTFLVLLLFFFFLTCKRKSQPRAHAGGRSPAGSTLSESRAEQATRRFVAQELDQTQITAQALHRDRRQRL